MLNFNKRLLTIEKRIRFIISTAILSISVFISTFFFFDKALYFILAFIILGYIFTYFALLEEIEKIEWLTLFLIPILFTVSFYLFFFLFPTRWLTRFPFIILYTVSIYAIFRANNIFNVGVEKNLQLYRAAFSVNYFFHTIVIFFISNFLFSLRLNPLLNGLFSFLITSILAMHFIWTIKLDLRLNKTIIKYGLFIGLVLGEAVVVLSFYPFEMTVLALLLTTAYYSLAGLVYSYLDQRLFKETVREYLFVIIFVFFIAFLSSFHW